MKRLLSFIICTVLFTLSLTALVSCGDSEQVTTVSADEWAAALKRDNFTITGFLTENGEQEPLTFKAAQDVYYSENDGYTAWCIKKSDGWYMYPNGGAEGQLLPSFSATVSFSLISFRLPEYSAFRYDETVDAYVIVNADYSASYYEYRIYFSDGLITRFESRDAEGTLTYSFAISEYGTTSLTPPDNLG